MQGSHLIHAEAVFMPTKQINLHILLYFEVHVVHKSIFWKDEFYKQIINDSRLLEF